MSYFDNVPEEIANSTIFKFNVILQNGTTVKVDLSSDLDIDYENLEHILETVPAQYMYWAAIYSEVKHLVNFLEQRVTKRKSWLIKSTVDRAKKEGLRLTDKQIQAIVEVDEVDVNEITAKCIEENNKKDKPLSYVELQKQIEDEVNRIKNNTLPYLEAQLLIAQKNAGKLYNVVQAMQMKSENCRSLAGFKRQEKEQSSNLK